MITSNLLKKVITRVALVLIIGASSATIEAAIADCCDICGGTNCFNAPDSPPCQEGQRQVGNCCCYD